MHCLGPLACPAAIYLVGWLSQCLSPAMLSFQAASLCSPASHSSLHHQWSKPAMTVRQISLRGGELLFRTSQACIR